MRAIAYHRYGTPDLVALEEVETPTPEASQVRIKIHAAVVSTADSGFRSGTPWFARIFTGVTRPKNPILGTEFAGEVDAVGVSVSRFRIGDRVFAASGTELGGHAELICLPEDGALALMPKDVTLTPRRSARAVSRHSLS
jgi:NADPH:quinone reductase-like Zn-dependent oxidoreductase